MDTKQQKWYDMMYWELTNTYDDYQVFAKGYDELYEKYGDVYHDAIRMSYWALKLGRCNTALVRNMRDHEVAEFLNITEQQLLDVINSEDLDAQLQDTESM